jgi:hypothetical protein
MAMSEVYFQNHRIDPDTWYFVYIGELKNYGLNIFLKEALGRILKRPVNFIAVVPDILDQYHYSNLLVINPLAKAKFLVCRHKCSCRIPAQTFMRSVSEIRTIVDVMKELRDRQGRVFFYMYESCLEMNLDALDAIDHVETKRLGTRIPVTAPMRVDEELLGILAASNAKKPVRVVTQINSAQEITPVSKETFRRLSGAVSAVLNQAVLLKGINDSSIKMWQLCETIHSAYVRPYYVFNCSYLNPQFAHLRVPVEKGRDIIESMYGNIAGDAIPRYIATAGGKIPLHRSNVVAAGKGALVLRKPWSAEEVDYPDADPKAYADKASAFAKGR